MGRCHPIASAFEALKTDERQLTSRRFLRGVKPRECRSSERPRCRTLGGVQHDSADGEQVAGDFHVGVRVDSQVHEPIRVPVGAAVRRYYQQRS